MRFATYLDCDVLTQCPSALSSRAMSQGKNARTYANNELGLPTARSLHLLVFDLVLTLVNRNPADVYSTASTVKFSDLHSSNVFQVVTSVILLVPGKSE